MNWRAVRDFWLIMLGLFVFVGLLAGGISVTVWLLPDWVAFVLWPGAVLVLATIIVGRRYDRRSS